MDGPPTSTDEFHGRAAPLLEPIPGPEPAGQVATFDPRYEAVRAEIGKLDAPTGGEIDWKQLVRTTRELLTTITKDFLLASYHAYSLVQLERWAGLAVGLAALEGMIDRFWEKGFPPAERPRGRGNALDWLVARLEILVPELRPNADEVPAFESVRARWSALSTSMRDRLGEHCPGMGGVADALERHRLALPAVEPSSASTPTPSPPAPSEPAPSEPAPSTTPQPVATPPSAASAPAAAPSDPLAEITAKAETWLQPIPGGTPAGIDARFEPGYEAARTEVAKLDAVNGAPPEWKIVAEQAGAILETKSKDLLMAGYFAYAGLKRGGLRELAIGVAVVTGVIDRFWDDLQPTRVRGRSNALAWFIDQTELALTDLPLDPKMRADVLALEAAVARLAAVTRDRFGADAPATSGLGDRMKRMVLAVPEPKPETPPPPPTPTPSASAPAAAPTTTVPTRAVASAAAPKDAESIATFLQETGRALVQAAHLARAATPASPTGYRLLRVGLYLHVVQPPPGDAGGKTQIPALPAQRREQFLKMEQHAKWVELVDEAESALAQFRFCLDLHRITHRALERIGESHAAARTAVVAELGAFLRRFPTLLDLSAVDGTPLADAETKSWIGEVVLAGSGGAVASTGGNEDEAAGFAEIRGMMTSGKQGEAMKLATARIDASTSLHQRFERRLQLAQVCLDAGQAMLARGLYAALDRELTERGIDEWEPRLAARVLEGFVRSIRVTVKAGARYEGADLVYERLCLLDPAAAARLSG
jgi:type VI secretion system protein VasJ